MNRIFRITLPTVAVAAAILINARSVTAATYAVNRSWSDPTGPASLVGTVDIPLGNYTIMNGASSPFTVVNLTLTVNGTAYSLVKASTSQISGTGQFFIDAVASTLIFDTANGNNQNPADLNFMTESTDDRYAIGSDGIPAFENAITSAGWVGNNNLTFPLVFGTSVPEPSSLVLLSLAAGVVLKSRRRR